MEEVRISSLDGRPLLYISTAKMSRGWDDITVYYSITSSTLGRKLWGHLVSISSYQ